MTEKHDIHAQDSPYQLAEGLAGDEAGGWINAVLAEEEELDRHGMWRLGSWGAGTVGAVIVGILATQSPVAVRRDQLAAAELQTQQVQWIAKESENKARQLAAAVDTLNSDRDRLYARVTVLEENLESVTGSIARQKAAASLPAVLPAPQGKPASAPDAAETVAAIPADSKSQPVSRPSPAPKIAPVASIPSPPPTMAPVEQKTAAAEPEKKQPEKSEPEKKETTTTGALAPKVSAASDTEGKPVQKTAFGVELGGANSVEGIRAVWRSLAKSNGALLTPLHPIVVLKEGNDGLGMKLRLVAGPLGDAAEVARICAVLIENKRACSPSVYDGQRLAMADEKKPDAKPAAVKRHPPHQAASAPSSSPFSSLFGFR